MKKYLLLTQVVFLLSFSFQDSFGAATPPRTKCHIEVNNPHISSHLLKQNKRAVKVNARSKCNKPMTDLVLTVEIYKTGLLRNHQVAHDDSKLFRFVKANKIIKNENAYSDCKNNRKTTYYGVAYARAKINGKEVKTLHVFSEKSITLNCGN